VVRTLAALRLATTGHGPVFTGRRGRRLQPYRVSQLVNESIHAAGYTITAHQLRHRCATTALEISGGDLLAVRDLLGHASVATTQIYTKVMAGRTAKTSRAMQLPAA
jgi:integrase/recombinase XerC